MNVKCRFVVYVRTVGREFGDQNVFGIVQTLQFLVMLYQIVHQ